MSSEFQTRLGGEFIRSFLQERNFHGKTPRNRLIVTSGNTSVVKPTQQIVPWPDGTPLANLFTSRNHFSAFVPPDTGGAHWHKMAVSNSEQLRVGVFRAGLTVPLTHGVTGSPASIRYYFQVRGISEMVKLRHGGSITFEGTDSADNQMFANAYALSTIGFSNPLKPETLMVDLHFRTSDAPQQSSDVTFDFHSFGPIINRIDDEPGSLPGCFFYDRVIAASGILSAGSLTSRQISPQWYNNDSGNELFLGGAAEGVFHGGNPITDGRMGDQLRFRNEGPLIFWQNHPTFNHASLFAEDGQGDMIPAGGFFSVTGSGERIGLANCNVIEVRLIGALPEPAHRPVEIHDLVVPKLLNDFPEEP